MSPERLFNSVGLVKGDLRGGLLDTTLIDVMWSKQSPETQLEREGESPLTHTNIQSVTCTLTVPHTLSNDLPTINQVVDNHSLLITSY